MEGILPKYPFYQVNNVKFLLRAALPPNLNVPAITSDVPASDAVKDAGSCSHAQGFAIFICKCSKSVFV